MAALLALAAACSSDNQSTVAESQPKPASTTDRTTNPGTTGPTTSSLPTSTTSRSTSTTLGSTSTPTVASTPATPAPSTDGGTPTSDEDEIVARYIGYWDARFAVLSADAPGDPNDPRFADFATGAQLASVLAETQRFNDQGRRLARPPDPAGLQRVIVQSVEGDRAELQECFVDDAQVVDRASGAVVDADVVTLNSIATMRFVDGVWKLEEATVVQRWEGVAGCALAE